MYDSANESVELFRLEYDIELTQAKILAAGLPERLASRLTDGR